MPKRDRKTYASEFVHGKKRPPPTPSAQPHLAPRSSDPALLEVTNTSVTSSLAREDRSAKDRHGAEAAARVSVGQLDDLRQSSTGLLEQSKSNENTQALQVTMADA